MEDRHGGPAAESGFSEGERRDELAAERDARASARETELDAREIRADAQEARESDRAQETEEILTAADERDGRAEMRDRVADERERAASLRSFLHDDEYAAALQTRRAAAMDRSHSKTDRISGASDRAKLSGQLPADTAVENGQEDGEEN